jgi:exonuclease VII large subunit
MAIINRGYAIVTRKKDGSRVTDIFTIATGYDILVRLMNGEFEARVTDVKERNGI